MSYRPATQWVGFFWEKDVDARWLSAFTVIHKIYKGRELTIAERGFGLEIDLGGELERSLLLIEDAVQGGMDPPDEVQIRSRVTVSTPEFFIGMSVSSLGLISSWEANMDISVYVI
jgi:hypothetical protein